MSDTTEGPMAKMVREAFEGIQLWALHIEGPDELIPAPSKPLAEFAATVTNKWLFDAAGDDAPIARAVVVEWTHGYEAWKAGSEQFAAEWSDWLRRQDAAAHTA